MPEGIGYRWLIERYELALTQALRMETVIGSTRGIVSDGTTERRTVQELLRPEATLAGHLGFALKHEGVHLEALSRLFAVAPAADIEDWIRREPTRSGNSLSRHRRTIRAGACATICSAPPRSAPRSISRPTRNEHSPSTCANASHDLRDSSAQNSCCAVRCG